MEREISFGAVLTIIQVSLTVIGICICSLGILEINKDISQRELCQNDWRQCDAQLPPLKLR
jgi:hypothetical protein